MSTVLTHTDWMLVLQEAFAKPSEDGLKSKRELQQETGLGEDALTRRLNIAIDNGLVVPVVAPRLGRCGLVKPTQCYRLNDDMIEKLRHERQK